MVLHSGAGREPVYVSYHWLQNDSVVEWNGIRTMLMSDCRNETVQFMKLKAPSSRGNFRLIIDITFENKKWLDNWCRRDVTIR